jgi:hypothetical protein
VIDPRIFPDRYARCASFDGVIKMQKIEMIVDQRDGAVYAVKEAESVTITVGYLKSYGPARLSDGWYYWTDDRVLHGTYESSGLEPFASMNEAWGEARDYADIPVPGVP